MKKIIFIALLFWTNFVHAVDWYVSATGSGTGTIASPLSFSGMVNRINNLTIKSGDNVFFAKGNVFNNSMYINSVTAQNNIYFGSYGTGAKPRFWAHNTIGVFNVIGKSGWTFDGLNFEDTVFVNDHVAVSPMNAGIRLGDFSDGGVTTNNCVIKNCDVKNAGLGFVINGNYNQVLNCNISDLGNVLNTPNTGGATAYEDYGANGITLKGNYNRIIETLIRDAWCASYDFGMSGGAIEFYGSCSFNTFLRMKIIDCGAVGEFGSGIANALSQYNEFTYSQIINCGSLSYINFSGVFSTYAKNLRYWNNVIVEQANSRFSTSTTGLPAPYDGIWKANTSPTGERTLLAMSNAGETGYPDTVFDLRNNIFFLTNSQRIANTSTVASKTIRRNNLYSFTAGSSTGYTNGTGDITGSPGWTSTAGNPNTNGWDYTITAGSIAINAGMPLGYTIDHYGKAIINNPDIGISEFGNVVVTPPAPPTRIYILTHQQSTPIILKPGN
jgi:hypothetical protein